MLASKDTVLEKLKEQMAEVATPLEIEPWGDDLRQNDLLTETESKDEEDTSEKDGSSEEEGSATEAETFSVMLLKKDADNVDRDILTTLHSGFGTLSNQAEGEYYFMDKEEIGLDTFVVLIRVVSEVPARNAAELATLVSLINPELVGGNFAFDPDEGELQYLMRVPLSEDTPEDMLISVAGSAIALSLSESRQFARSLVTLAKKA